MQTQGRWVKALVKPTDIDGHHKVEVRLKTDSPTARLQQVTTLNQLTTQGPDGLPLMALEDAMLYAGVEMEDLAGWRQRRSLEALRTHPEYESIFREYQAALNLDELKRMRQESRRALRQIRRMNEREAERDAEEAAEEVGQESLTLMPEQWSDPAVLDRIKALVGQGMSPQVALEQDLPFGVPDQEGAAPPAPGGEAVDPRIEEILAGFREGQGETPAPPGPFTGFDNGVPPTALPAAMQGGLPRPAMDPAALAVEGMEQQMQRGGKPAPR
jgi:hypothetical protein